ncbi:MAG: hypothetical protein QM734_08850 [Cyclobacteriaceae bacterium]
MNDFVVSGNDIYVVGDDYVNGLVQAKYWKNGISSTLSSNGETTCIFFMDQPFISEVMNLVMTTDGTQPYLLENTGRTTQKIF